MGWNIRGKTVLLTGATDGIGQATAFALARLGASLVLVCRDKERGERLAQEIKKKTKNTNIEILVCDLSKLSQVAAAAAEYKKRFNTLHVLIHVAGVQSPTAKISEDIERTAAVNYLAPFLLTELLLPTLKFSAPARCIMVTSSMHKRGVIDVSNLQGSGHYDGSQAYANAKLALMLYALHLSRTLNPTDILVATVHPGWIRTKLATGMGEHVSLKQKLYRLLYMRPPSWGARSIVYLATTPDIAHMHGAYVIKQEPAEAHSSARDVAAAENLVRSTRVVLSGFLS